MSAGAQRRKVIFAKPSRGVRGRLGATKGGFSGHCTVWAEFIYQGGDVAVEGGRVAGRNTLKVRVHSFVKTRAIKPEDQMTDSQTGDVYEVRQVDAVTQLADVYLVVEGPLSIPAESGDGA